MFGVIEFDGGLDDGVGMICFCCCVGCFVEL